MILFYRHFMKPCPNFPPSDRVGSSVESRRLREAIDDTGIRIRSD